MKKLKKNKHLVIVASIVGFLCLLFFSPIIAKQISKIPGSLVKEKETPAKQTVNACEVQITVSGSDQPVDLEEYVVGVVAAEMPANFHPEALKAQAIASRTYVLKSTNLGQVAIEPTVAKQVFYDEGSRKENWNQSFEQFETKVRQAVESTKGEVINYNGELITAMFHSMSNGMTESSKNYSGQELPYLQPVASTDFQHAENYEVQKTFTIEQWNQLLNVNWTIEDINKIRLTKNNTGRVETVSMGDKQWSGRDVRTALDLRSTDFRIDVANGKIVVTTEGYGHGVGMSQYGANAMADKGATAHDIIKHYYKNTDIEKISCK